MYLIFCFRADSEYLLTYDSAEAQGRPSDI